MARTEHIIPVPHNHVFAVLADGWSYSDWVVGTSHVRDVDAEWPEPGAKLYVRIGCWPFALNGETSVMACDPGHRLVLKPKLWPLGELVVDIELEPVKEGTRVVIREEASAGLMHWTRNKMHDVALHGRNKEGLRRLADLASRKRNDHEAPHDL